MLAVDRWCDGLKEMLSDDGDRVLCRGGGPRGTDRRDNDFRVHGFGPCIPGNVIFRVCSFRVVVIATIGAGHVSDDPVRSCSDS